MVEEEKFTGVFSLSNWNGRTDFYDLDYEKRIAYLKAYWQVSSEFHEHVLEPVPDEKVKQVIEGFKEKPSPEVRRLVKLENWKCELDPNLSGRKEMYFTAEFDDSDWETVSVPHAINYLPKPISIGTTGQYGGAKFLVGEYAVWFRKNISLEAKEPFISFLEFESCDIDSTVWVNEMPLMIDHLGLYPFRVEIPNLKTENSIVVEVRKKVTNDPEYLYQGSFQCAYIDRNYIKEIFKDEGTGWRGREWDWPSSGSHYCGISGEVNLVVTFPVFIDNLFVYTEEVNEQARLVMQFEVSNATNSEFAGSLNVKLWRWYPVEDKSTVQELEVPFCARPWQSTILKKEIVVENPALWEPESPNLYIAHVSLSDGTEVKDDLYESFGIRSFKAKDGDFYLNGKRIFLKGTHYLPFNPTSPAVCPDDYWIAKDILLHKYANMNAARMPSDTRVHYGRIADYADQMGLLLVWAAYCSMWWVHPELENLARRDIPNMVRALRNHPSIITYEMGDEILSGGEKLIAKRRYEYYKLAEQLVSENDPTRLVCPCGCWTNNLYRMIYERVQKGLTLEEARRTSLKDLDLFLSPHVYWDLHGPGQLEIINVYGEEPTELEGRKRTPLEKVIKYLGDLRHPLIETEFGANSMPDWELYKDEPWYNLWIDNPLGNSQPRLEKSIYGRKLDMKEWRLSQAYSAIQNKMVIEFCREIKPKVDGLFISLFNDLWTSHWGIVDFHRRAKLSYTVAKSLFQERYVMGAHGDFALGPDDALRVTVINDGNEIAEGKLKITVKDARGEIVWEESIKNLRIPEDSVVDVSKVRLDVPETDLYSVEYYLYDDKNSLIEKSMDFLYIQSG